MYKEEAIRSLEAATEKRIKELRAAHLDEFEFNRHRWGEVILSDGTRLVWELTACRSSFINKNELAYHWAKNGWINRGDRQIFNYWSLSTYFYDKNGQCWGIANPQILKYQNKLNFKWVIESTEANAVRLLVEMIKEGEALIK